ncbi:MAG: helix-turn-helix transcriptional regulator [Lachnospiraceae bacterium]|nr:helix-turn-helix transcriptional regulator [Lachnospiraceae bacterium]
MDLDADTIWEDGTLVETEKETSINKLLAYQLLLAREKVNITQKQLSERTGIYQADISKIERGIGNPSLSTLKRLAEGLGMKLEISFSSD